jgi:hypothetical protein
VGSSWLCQDEVPKDHGACYRSGMSPGRVHTWIAGLACFFVGALSGGLLYRAVYDDRVDHVALGTDEGLFCPPAAPCPACPNAPDCGELGLIPPSTDGSPEPVLPDLVDAPSADGLPASVIAKATTALSANLAPCLTLARTSTSPLPELLVLDLQVVATATVGFISEVHTDASSGYRTRALADCITRSVENTRFDWQGPVGSLRLQYPVKLTY